MKAAAIALLVLLASSFGFAQKHSAIAPKKDVGLPRTTTATKTTTHNGLPKQSLNSNAVSAALKNKSTTANAKDLARIEHSSFAHQHTAHTPSTGVPKNSLANVNSSTGGSKTGGTGKHMPHTRGVSHAKAH